MIRCNPTTDSIELVTSSAQAIHYDVSFLEDDAVADTVADGSNAGAITSATTTTIMAAGAANKSRRVQQISLINAGSALNAVTVQKDVSGTNVELAQANLLPGEALRYTSNRGWICYDAEGREKQAPVGSQVYVTTAVTNVVLASDVVNNNATANTMQDVTGLSFPVISGETYWFSFVIPYQAAASTTGSRWSINGPASPTLLSYVVDNTLTVSTSTLGSQSAYDVPAAANATSAVASSLGGNIARIEGFIRPSADGTVIARFASEVAASAITAKAGALLRWMKVL